MIIPIIYFRFLICIKFCIFFTVCYLYHGFHCFMNNFNKFYDCQNNPNYISNGIRIKLTAYTLAILFILIILFSLQFLCTSFIINIFILLLSLSIINFLFDCFLLFFCLFSEKWNFFIRTTILYIILNIF